MLPVTGLDGPLSCCAVLPARVGLGVDLACLEHRETGVAVLEAGRAILAPARASLVPGLGQTPATEHQLDAVVCALTADLWLGGRGRRVGDREEGQTVVSGIDTRPPSERPAALRRAAERPATSDL